MILKILFYIPASAFFLLLVCQKSMGQDVPLLNLKGSIVSISDGSTIDGAAVILTGTDKTTITDENGNFELKLIIPGTYKLMISHLSFLPFEKTINITADIHLGKIFLEEVVKEMDEIVISSGFFTTREETPFKIESITGKNLQQSGSHNLMNALSTIPGVSSISYGPGIGKPVIRGLSFSRIMTIYQGIRFENQQWGEEHGLGLNDLGVDRIEIIKGPASVLYGSGALGGVINIIDEKPFTEGLKGDVFVQGFSNTLGLRSNIGIMGGNKKGHFFNFRANGETHTDYTDGNNRIMGNSRFKNTMIKAKGGIQKNWGSSVISYTYNRQLMGIIEEDEMDNSLATTRPDRKILIPYQEVTDHFFSLQNELLLRNQSSVRFNVSHHLNLREENEESFDLIDLGLILNTSTYDFKYKFLPSPSTELIVGVQGFRQSNQNMNDAQETLLPDAVLYDNSVFGLILQNINKLKIQGGLRFDYRNITANSRMLPDFILPGDPENREISRNFSGFTGSIGSTYNFAKNLIAKVNIASGFRAPDLAELFSNGEHPGTNRFERGNIAFDREQNIETDLSIHLKNENFSLEAASYLNLINNYIFFNPTEELVDNLMIWQFEQENVYLYGGEAGVIFHPQLMKGLTSKHTFSLVRGLLMEENTFLPLMPADRFFHEIRYQHNKKGFFDSQYLMLQIQNVLEQNRIGENERPTAAYSITSIGGGANTKSQKYEIQYNLIVNNLFNKQYMDHLAITRQFDVHNMGRNLTMGIKVIF